MGDKVINMKISEFIQNISGNKYNELLSTLYGENDKIISKQKERYINALKSFSSFFPNRDDVKMYSASGRTEIGGNHTDHQRGAILAGAVNLDIIGVVAFNESSHVRVKSEGYDLIESKSNIEAGDYFGNIAFVGKKTNGTPIIVILDNAICTSGFDGEGKNKDKTVIKCTFECTQEINGDLTKLPYHIYYPTPAVAEQNAEG